MNCIYFSYLPQNKHITTKSQPNKFINKLTPLLPCVQNEINLSHIIKTKILNYNLYFHVIESSHTTYIGKMDTDMQYLQSIDINNSSTPNKNTVIIKRLDTHFQPMHIYLRSLNCSKYYISQVIGFYYCMFTALTILNNVGIIHNNLSFFSLVIEKHQIKLTDFSQAIYLDDLVSNELNYFKNNKVNLMIPELCFLNYIINNNLKSISLNNINNWIEEYFSTSLIQKNSSIYLLSTFGKHLIEKNRLEMEEWLKQFINIPIDRFAKEVILYSNTWDKFQLSMLFLRIFIDIHRKIKTNNKFILNTLKLLVSNIYISPIQRSTMNEHNMKWDEIILDTCRKDYEEVFQLL
jgi:hypothetical protein